MDAEQTMQQRRRRVVGVVVGVTLLGGGTLVEVVGASSSPSGSSAMNADNAAAAQSRATDGPGEVDATLAHLTDALVVDAENTVGSDGTASGSDTVVPRAGDWTGSEGCSAPDAQGVVVCVRVRADVPDPQTRTLVRLAPQAHLPSTRPTGFATDPAGE